MSDLLIKQMIGIRIRYGMRHSESSRKQVNDTLQEVFYEDSTIGMLATSEYSAEERKAERAKDKTAPYQLDDDVTVVEQFEYQVEREENNLHIFKDKVDGQCAIEGLCHFRRVHPKQNLRLYVYQVDMFTAQVEAQNISKHNSTLYNVTLLLDSLEVQDFKQVSEQSSLMSWVSVFTLRWQVVVTWMLRVTTWMTQMNVYNQ